MKTERGQVYSWRGGKGENKQQQKETNYSFSLPGVTDEQTLWEKPSSPLVQKHIQPPNSSSLVSHDEFNEDLIGKVWLGPLSSGSSGITSPRAPQIAETVEVTSIIKHRKDEIVKERQRAEVQRRQGMEGENVGGRQGRKQMEPREALPVDEGQGRAHD